MKKLTGVLLIAVVCLILAAGIAQASNAETTPVFTTQYRDRLVFCYGTNAPWYTNCVGGYREVRIYSPDPAHNNQLYVHSCYQFLVWICDTGFWMTTKDVWYTETNEFPHLKWIGNVVMSFSESPEVWNKLLQGRNKYIPTNFGGWNGMNKVQGSYPAPGKSMPGKLLYP